MVEILNITKALADENRIRALMLLTEGELCVCQIIEMLGLAPSTVSKHMSILRQAGLVKAQKQGRWMHYSLADEGCSKEVDQILDWLSSGLKEDAVIQKDREKLKSMLMIDKETLCKKQRN